MSINTCRLCGHEFFAEPLLRQENMPRAAQCLPDRESLQSDKGITLEVCQCSGCGLVQLSSDPVPYYKDVIRAAAFSEEMKEFRRRQFSKFVEGYSLKGKKVIEVGCGRGEYLAILQQCGVEAYGLEHSEEAVTRCADRGLRVSQGYLHSSAVRLPEAPFDAFMILSFLEHLPEPNAALGGIGFNVKDDAVGIIEVPNFEMIVRRNLFSEFIFDHLFYFTRETLNTTVGLNGFEMVDCTEVWHDYIISAVVKKRKKMDLSPFPQRQEMLQDALFEYLGLFKGKSVAIWGAGHQALAILSLTNLAGKIKYVVDSAVFKQGKYTPATHIPIVSPDTLDSDPVDAVIVMAGSYSDEVAMNIRKTFDKQMNISILRDFKLEKYA